MSPLDLLLPEAPEAAIPFSARLAEQRRILREPVAVARADRRAFRRRSAEDLEWLRIVRLVGGTGSGVTLIDLSEGGALLEVDGPLRPGVILTLEISGSGLEAQVPLEVLRCYVASLRDNVTIYRGACAFTHPIELPDLRAGWVPTTTAFVGTDAALTYLLGRCRSDVETGSGESRITLERTEVLHILDSLHTRKPAGHADPLGRYASELLGAVLPALRRGAPRDVVVAALEQRLRGLPERWQARLHPTREKLMSIIAHCFSTQGERAQIRGAGAATTSSASGIILPDAIDTPSGPQANAESDRAWQELTSQTDSGYQKIVVRYLDGDIVKGYTQDFHPSRAQFSLWPTINATASERLVIPMATLKAVFFVRDFNGNAGYRERKTFNTRNHGRRMEVTFADNEVVLGTTLNYRPDGQGFFLTPVDSGANNTRIFVVSSAVRRVRFL
jgi:hypothetical protein